jgi:hypothetical protein
MLRAALVLTFAATTLSAQAPFEGAISMTLTADDGKSTDVAYMMKDGKIRMEMAGGRGGQTMVMIFDMAEKKMLMIMTAQKMYMEQDIGGGAVAAASEKAKPAKPGKFVATGKTETVAGYKCAHYAATEDDGSTRDVCVGKGLGAFRMPSSGAGRGGPPKDPSWKEALGEGGFPLKVQKGDKVVFEVKSIDKKPLDAALFAAPEGFRKMDMGGMPKRP